MTHVKKPKRRRSSEPLLLSIMRANKFFELMKTIHIEQIMQNCSAKEKIIHMTCLRRIILLK